MAEPSNSGATSGAAGPKAAEANRQVVLQKVYIKDASIEAPAAPQIFTSNAQPQIDVNVATAVNPVQDGHFDVVISITVTAKTDKETAFLVEVKQAGIFQVKGFDNLQEKSAVLGGYCANMLFPFAREAIADFVQKAGFPQLLLQPINFEALYRQNLAKQQKQQPESGIITNPSGKLN